MVVGTFLGTPQVIVSTVQRFPEPIEMVYRAENVPNDPTRVMSQDLSTFLSTFLGTFLGTFLSTFLSTFLGTLGGKNLLNLDWLTQNYTSDSCLSAR